MKNKLLKFSLLSIIPAISIFSVVSCAPENDDNHNKDKNNTIQQNTEDCIKNSSNLNSEQK